MKKTELSSIRMCIVAAAIMFVVSQPPPFLAQTTPDQKATGAAEWKTVEDVFGFPGAVLEV